MDFLKVFFTSEDKIL